MHMMIRLKCSNFDFAACITRQTVEGGARSLSNILFTAAIWSLSCTIHLSVSLLLMGPEHTHIKAEVCATTLSFRFRLCHPNVYDGNNFHDPLPHLYKFKFRSFEFMVVILSPFH